MCYNFKKQKEIKNMKKIYVANKQTGDFIEEVKTLDEAIDLIADYEAQDKADGTYEADFYDVVNDDHVSVRFELSANIHITDKFFATLSEAQEAAKVEQEYYLNHTAAYDLKRNQKENECIYIFELNGNDPVDVFELY
jgi:spore germination protein YaaH